MLRMLGHWLGYGETELDPAVQSEILVETARTEARMVILLIFVAIGFGVFEGLGSIAFRAVAWFTLIVLVPLLIDAATRRAVARELDGVGPQPPVRA